MAIGGLNAVLCGLVLLPLGRLAAVLTGLMYAVHFAAVYVEHTVLLEPPASTVLLLALVITRALGQGDGVHTAHYVVAGLLLGLSPTLKIWGVLAVLVVAGGLAWRRGLHRGLTVLLSAVDGLSLWTEQPRRHLGTALMVALLLAPLIVCLLVGVAGRFGSAAECVAADSASSRPAFSRSDRSRGRGGSARLRGH